MLIHGLLIRGRGQVVDAAFGRRNTTGAIRDSSIMRCIRLFASYASSFASGAAL
jgi:hypothetical protein